MRNWTHHQEFLQLWTAIQKEVSSRRSPLWTPTVATVEVSSPKQRTMVLREITPYNLVFFTDKRSDKCREINEHPSVSVHSYNSKARTQIQFYGTGLISTNHPKFEQWRLKGLNRAMDYATLDNPGTKISNEANVDYNLDLAIDNFSLLIVTVQEIQLLRLGDPHERCQWTRTKDDDWYKEWLVP